MGALAKLVGTTLFLGLSLAASASAPPDQKVDPSLLAIQEIFEPGLVQIGERVHAGFAYDYANFSFIEGDDGIILVDAGWFPGAVARALADLRAITDKPIVAIVYTHLHLDHSGGAAALLAGQHDDIPVYGPFGWERWVEESRSALRPVTFRRVFQQMGLVLPVGEDGTVGNGLSPPPRVNGDARLSHPPTITVDEDTELVIAGVKLQLLPVAGDLNEHLWVYVPGDDVLFTGDTPLHNSFPAMETARFEAGRDARRLVESYQRALEIDPRHIVPGHGRLLLGHDDVREIVTVNMDVTRFIADQVDRYYVKGYSADRVLDEIALPPYLANHPDLQPHYHRWEWMLRQRFIKRSGFIQESMDYLALTSYAEARRLVPLLGGEHSVLEKAGQALADDDPRWAARLATYILKANSGHEAARQLRQRAFLRVARTTPSANERNYLLTIIKEENGEVDWPRLFSDAEYQVARALPADELLDRMKIRVRAEAAADTAITVNVQVGDEPRRALQVRNQVLYLWDDPASDPAATLTMERDTLDRISARQLSWLEAIDQGAITVSGARSSAILFAGLIE